MFSCCGVRKISRRREYTMESKPDNFATVGDQNYEEIKKECLRSGKLFVDPKFPPSLSSLFLNGIAPDGMENIKWKRPVDIVRNGKPQFIVEGATRHDMDQGMLGNCWFIAATSTLAFYDKKKFEKVVPPDQSFVEGYAGIFRFNFWWYGKWVEIVVDDFLPTIRKSLIYCSNRQQPNEFWGALVEKAYAKLRTCYEGIEGGKIQDALVDLTGGISESYDLKDKQNILSNLYQLICKSVKMKSLIGGAIYSKGKSASEFEQPNGLYQGHAYSVTGLVLIDSPEKVSLLRLRNPWGRGEWNGAWSDRSPEMKNITAEQKEKLGLVGLDDGEFWISYEDMIANFDEIAFCHLQPDAVTAELQSDEHRDNWFVTKFHDAWIIGETAGGCGNAGSEDKFWTNPQFIMNLSESDHGDKDGLCTMVVSQMEKEKNNQNKIAMNVDLYLLRTSFDVKLNGSNVRNLAIRQQKVSDLYQYYREMTHHFELPQGKYVLIPSTYFPDEEAKFLLRVFTKKQANGSVTDAEPLIVPGPEEGVEDLFTKLYKFYARGTHMGAREMKRFLTDIFFKEHKQKITFNLETCRSLLAMMDQDGSGRLTIKEMSDIWAKIQGYTTIFMSADKNSSGFLETTELDSLLKKLNYVYDEPTFKILARRYGGLQDFISLTDFIQIICRLTMMKDLFNTHKVETEENEDKVETKENEDEVAQFTMNELMKTFMLY